jgi:UDP-N-acetylglucosamine 2-epimerase (non-hydrolysing)
MLGVVDAIRTSAGVADAVAWLAVILGRPPTATVVRCYSAANDRRGAVGWGSSWGESRLPPFSAFGPLRWIEDGSVVVVLGTRPEIIKLAEFVQRLGPAARIAYTGQHYDDNLAGTFFREFGLNVTTTPLGVGGLPRGEQIGEAVTHLTRYLTESPAQAVVVQGDTNAALAGALAANATETPLLHVEAGLRSYDRNMPEEHNRVLVDHLSDVCCAPTIVSSANLASEGIPEARVAITGNTVVEAVQRLLPGVQRRRELLAAYGLEQGRFIVATFHRPENVDEPGQLASILHELGSLPLPVVLPIHPRTAARVAQWGLGPLLEGLRVVDPVPYRAFLTLAAESACVVSDSGGVQEEVSVLKRPVVVVRASTERPEVLGTFAKLLPPGSGIRETVSEWLEGIEALHERLAEIPSPYGDGTASSRCVGELERLLARTHAPEDMVIA